MGLCGFRLLPYPADALVARGVEQQHEPAREPQEAGATVLGMEWV